jgi:predicted membrane-bound spermidine synthase
MNHSGKILTAVFSAGIASLLLELSLLREFVYVVGSTAFSNALIISVFLVGLAAGTYVGAWKRLLSSNETGAQLKFAFLQFSTILFITIFYITKDYFIYICMNQPLIIVYFILATFVPSFLSGAAYATAVELLFHRGQKYVKYIYACSTLGSVVGGLAHGFLFAPFFGAPSAYVCAIVCSALALLLVYPFLRKMSFKLSLLLITGLAVVVQTEAVNRGIFRFYQRLLFRENSPAGLVEVWRLQWNPPGFEMKVNNSHQYYSYDWDTRVHIEWAETTLGLVDKPCEVLLLGYGSGVSSAAFLRSEHVLSVDTVENSAAVIEAGARFYPDEYERIMTDRRSRILIRDFRNYVRFTERRYDIIVLDAWMRDPYASGFYTKEFFEQLKRILKPNGIVASETLGLSWYTTESSFPYIYRNVDPAVSEPFRGMVVFLSREPLSQRSESSYARIGSSNPEPLLYTDHRIYGLTWKSMSAQIRQYFRELVKIRPRTG